MVMHVCTRRNERAPKKIIIKTLGLIDYAVLKVSKRVDWMVACAHGNYCLTQ